MEKQNKRYIKTKKAVVLNTEDKPKKELKLRDKILILVFLFLACVGAIVGLAFLLVYKFHH